MTMTVKYYPDGGMESIAVEEILSPPFETVSVPGKVRPELLDGDPGNPESWITGYPAIAAWLRRNKKRRK